MMTNDLMSIGERQAFANGLATGKKEKEEKLGNLPNRETMLTYASILEKPQYYIHNQQKFLMPRGEIIDAAIAALLLCADMKRKQDV